MKKIFILVLVLIVGIVLLNNAEAIFKSTSAVNVTYITPKIENVSFYSICEGTITEANNGKYKATAYINEKDIPHVKKNSLVALSGAALGDKKYEGYISHISDKATSLNGAGVSKTVLECQITINNGDNDLKVGYNVTAAVTTLKVENAMVVDYNSVLSDGKNYWVYLVDDDKKAQKQYIEVFKESENGYIVQSGIKSADKIIYEPTENVLEFRRVNATVKGE